jgi:UDP-glucose 4-epimerase
MIVGYMDFVTLVTGGGGYIGTHVAKDLLDNTRDKVVVLDSFERSDQKFINSLKERYGNRLSVCHARLEDVSKVSGIIKNEKVTDVIHCAAYIDVAESNRQGNEILYRQKIVGNTENLLKAMRLNAVRRIVFSSTAAVYGIPQEDAVDKKMRITEKHQKNPNTVYGRCKRECEEALSKAAKEGSLDSAVFFRYFNAAGADDSGLIGEAHLPLETHVIPLAILAAIGIKKDFTIYGNNLETRDGTPLRDFIHVSDIAKSHRFGLENMRQGLLNGINEYNLGLGEGVTVREVVNLIRKISKKDFIVHETGKLRSPEESSVLCASNVKAGKELGWKPEYQLKEIVQTAVNWHCKLAAEGWYSMHGMADATVI